jgi:hypothetical protein
VCHQQAHEGAAVNARVGSSTTVAAHLPRATLDDINTNQAPPAALPLPVLMSLALPLLAGMLRESILIDTGYVDRGRLTAAYHHATTTAQIPSTLCDTITLEFGLRSLTSADERIRA